MAANAGCFVDRSPDVRAAGVFATGRKESAADCLIGMPEQETPDVVKRYRKRSIPDVGAMTILPNNPKVDPNQVFGIRTISENESAGALVSPQVESEFEKALARSRVPKTAKAKAEEQHRMQLLSSGQAYGKVEKSSGSAGDCLSPSLAPDADEQEALARSLYLKSHAAYDAGEQVTRNYEGTHFNVTNRYGKATPQDKNGSGVSKSLKWSSGVEDLDDSAKNAAKGLKEEGTGKDQVFGISTRPFGDTVQSLISSANRTETVELLAETLRSQLRVGNDVLNSMEQSLVEEDKSGTGKVTEDQLRDACKAHHLGVGEIALGDMLKLLSNERDEVDYLEFLSCLRSREAPEDDASDKVFGMKTIRTDLQAPGRVSVSDTNNYGDQGTAGQVLSPNVYMAKGISEFETKRNSKSKGQIRKIFDAANLGESHDFETVWQRAQAIAGVEGDDSRISVQSFQTALESV